MPIAPLQVEATPPKAPWWKKSLGLLGAIGGAVAAPFTAGATIAPAAAAAGTLGAIGATAGAIGTAAGVASALSPMKGGQSAARVANPNEQQSGVRPPQMYGNVPKSSMVDKLTSVFGAIESAGDLGKTLADKKLGGIVNAAVRTPEVGRSYAQQFKIAAGTQDMIDALGGQENANYFQQLMGNVDDTLAKRTKIKPW